MKNIIKSILKYIVLFIFGGLVYYLIEIGWRGYSHWTMFILGGLCFVSIGLINNLFSWDLEIEYQAIVGAGIITTLEFITGYIVNIKLNWNIWDYSDLPLNFMGQICLPFTVIWIFMSLLIIYVDDWLRHLLFKERKPKYKTLI